MAKEDKYIDQAIKNINDDREITRELLDDAIKWLAKDESRHREIGVVLAKYVETLQRSNDQLVRVVNLMKKNSSQEGLTKADREEIFDMLQDKEEVEEDE